MAARLSTRAFRAISEFGLERFDFGGELANLLCEIWQSADVDFLLEPIAVRNGRPGKRLRERNSPAMPEITSVARVTAPESTRVETRLLRYRGCVSTAA